MATTLYNGNANGKANNDTSNAYTFYLEIILNSQSVTNNTSNITINHYAKGNNGYNYEQYSTPKSYIKIYDNNSETTITKKTTAVNAIGSSKVKIGTWTGNVTHKLDGRLTINVTAEYKPNNTTWYLPANKSLSSGNLVLTPLHKVPVVNNFTITENNQQLINAGLSDDTFVARLSNKTINADVTYYDNATLANLKTVVGTTIYDSNANPMTIDLSNCNIASDTVLILVEATDSLNAKGILGISKNAIPYILPALTPTSSNIKRNGQTSGKVKLSLKGIFYNGNVGNVANTIQLKFAYWKNGESESSTFYDIPSADYIIDGNNVELSNWNVAINGTEITDVDKRYSYRFRIKAIDSFGSTSIIDLLCVSGEYLMCKFKDRVDFKKITVGNKEIFGASVGDIVITNQNSNPSSKLGGTWTLIDKEFTPASIGSAITANTTNCNSAGLTAKRAGHSISFNGSCENKVAFNDTEREIGTMKLSDLGVTAIPDQYRFLGYSDGGNSELFCYVNTSGKVATVDVGGGLTSISAGNTFYYSITITYSDISQMLDSACNKFYWKRTA